MKRFVCALCLYLVCPSPTLAQQFKVGDRVFITTLRKYGTVVPGGVQGATAMHPSVRLDDAPVGSGGTIYDASTVVSAASVVTPAKAAGSDGQPLGNAPATANSSSTLPTGTSVDSDPPIVNLTLPSGNYVCSKTANGSGLMGFGAIEIKGRTYRGMDASIGPFIPFIVRDGNIDFTGGLKGLEDMKVSKSYISRDSNGQPIIVIRYSTTHRGFTSVGGFECSCK